LDEILFLAKVFLKKLPFLLSFILFRTFIFLVPSISLAWSWRRTRIGSRGVSSGELGSRPRVAFVWSLPSLLLFMSSGCPEEALAWGAVPREVWVRLASMCCLLAA
jgi:hypothetical protein